MGEVPGWMREQLQVEGWVVVESIETFDVHLGQWYPNRAQAVQKALAGDALLASRGKATLSREVEGEFLVGRLRRSAKPVASEADVLLVYALDSVERHVRKPTRPAPTPTPGPRGTHRWTCPNCKETWLLPKDEPRLPEEQARCPECGEPPSEFTPGQIVRVRRTPGAPLRLGVMDEPVQTDAVDPESGEVWADDGPYTGEYMVWHLTEGYGSAAPIALEVEREIFANLPREPERRLTLASNLMTGTSARPEEIVALDPEEEKQLLGGS